MLGGGKVYSSFLLIPSNLRLSYNYKVTVVLFPVLVKGESLLVVDYLQSREFVEQILCRTVTGVLWCAQEYRIEGIDY